MSALFPAFTSAMFPMICELITPAAVVEMSSSPLLEVSLPPLSVPAFERIRPPVSSVRVSFAVSICTTTLPLMRSAPNCLLVIASLCATVTSMIGLPAAPEMAVVEPPLVNACATIPFAP